VPCGGYCAGIEIFHWLQQILDEADKLLEMGFKEEVLELVKTMPVDRQTLFFSATMTSKVEELAAVTLKKPVNVQADPLFDVSDKLAQEFVRVREVWR
jgi:ATP-dependent RNA helicase DDX27